MDHFLNPTTFKLRSYIRDTTHLLQILANLPELPPNSILVTLDVASLYTNIPTDFGLKAAKKALQQSRGNPIYKPSNKSLIQLLEQVLKKNNFQFNGQNFLQIKGTAMGTKVAVGYANTTLGLFEDMHVYTYHTQPYLYKRFIDDIFMIWTAGHDSLLEFINHMNTRDSNFRFTQEISENHINFLDTKISIENNKLVTDLYSKPTDSHNYLRYDSSHPQRCKDSIHYSQFLRIRRICSNSDTFEKHVSDYSNYFKMKGYPEKLISEAIALARSKNRNDLLNPPQNNTQTKKKDNSVFLITTYHPDYQFLPKQVKNNWPLLGRNITTEFLYKKRLICGYRRPPNLRDLLMKAKVPQKPGDTINDPTFKPAAPTTTAATKPNLGPQKQRSITDFFLRTKENKPVDVSPSTSLIDVRTNTKPLLPPHSGRNKHRGFSTCNRIYCRYCPLLNKTGTITNFYGEEFKTMKNISCRSSNLIYCITCKICKKQYVGQTLLRLKDRFIHHFSSIEKDDTEKSVSRHFNSIGHNGIKDMTIHVLEFIKKPPRSIQATNIRNRRETSWTHALRTLAPYGLNMENPKEFKSHLKKTKIEKR